MKYIIGLILIIPTLAFSTITFESGDLIKSAELNSNFTEVNNNRPSILFNGALMRDIGTNPRITSMSWSNYSVATGATSESKINKNGQWTINTENNGILGISGTDVEAGQYLVKFTFVHHNYINSDYCFFRISDNNTSSYGHHKRGGASEEANLMVIEGIFEYSELQAAVTFNIEAKSNSNQYCDLFYSNDSVFEFTIKKFNP